MSFDFIIKEEISEIEIKNSIKDFFKNDNVFRLEEDFDTRLDYIGYYYDTAHEPAFSVYLNIDGNYTSYTLTDVASYFADRFNTIIIIDDGSNIPLTWLMVLPDKTIHKCVSVTDDEGETLDYQII
jgi:hypothetical protein